MKFRLACRVGVATLILSGCADSKVIPPNDMALILKQIYLTDGTLSAPSAKDFTAKDSIAYYEPILERYGYTAAEFDSSISYYAYHTKTFDEILDRVILELSKQQEEVDKKIKQAELVARALREENLWPHKARWDMAIDHTHNPSLTFSIPSVGAGVYTVSFDAQLFPQDNSEETRLYLYFYYDNKTPEGSRTGEVSERYTKDSTVRSFSYRLKLNDSLVTHLNGALYDHEGERKNLQRRAVFSNISIIFEGDSLASLPKKRIKRIEKQKPVNF